MGNIISQDNVIKSKTLRDYINTWALDTYDGGMYDDSMKTNKTYQYLLKKRACCTRQPTVKIALPYANLNITTSLYDGINYIDNTAPIPITVFPSDDYLTAANCTFPNNSDNNVPYLLIVDKAAAQAQADAYAQGHGQIFTSFTTPDACKILYEGSTGGYNSQLGGFCKKVKADRKLKYDNDIQVAYGPSTSDDNNVNSDCNCVLSIFAGNETLKSNLQSNQLYSNSDATIVQNLDQRCSLMSTGAYNNYDAKVPLLCLNITQTIDSVVKGQVTNNPNCNATYGSPVAPAAAAPVAPVAPVASVAPVAPPVAPVAPPAVPAAPPVAPQRAQAAPDAPEPPAIPEPPSPESSSNINLPIIALGTTITIIVIFIIYFFMVII